MYQNECPDYAYRPKGSYPDAIEVSSGSARKINLWAALSFKGATSFVVSVNLANLNFNIIKYNHLI